MDGPREYYAKWYKLSQKKTNTTWFHLYVRSKEQNKWTNKIETDFISAENRLMVSRVEGEWDLVKNSKGIKKYRLEVTKYSQGM